MSCLTGNQRQNLNQHFISAESFHFYRRFLKRDSWEEGSRKEVRATYRLIRTDGMDLGAKHHRGEDEKEEAFKAQEDEEDDCCWR